MRPDIGSQPNLAAIGLGFAAAALVAVALSLWVLRPQTRSNGPVPLRAVKGIGAPALVGKVRYVKALGFAVESVEAQARQKGYWMVWATTAGGAGVALLAVFAVLGGFATQGGSVK